ncbi:MAG: O-antigen polymerase [Tepidisphaerales bacterium]
MSLSVSSPVYVAEVPAPSEPLSADPLAMLQTERSKYQPLFFLVPFLVAAVSWVAGGIALLTDFAWLLITTLCVVFLLAELRAFSFRWGIGGLLVFGGVLIWFCYDYFDNWFLRTFRFPEASYLVPEETLARATMWHAAFIPCMLLGMRIRLGGKVERLLARYPEPEKGSLYLFLILVLFAIGMSPYFIFVDEPFYMAIWNEFLGGRAGGALWTVGRTGNVNYSFGAYVAQILQVGAFASVLGAFYAICVARTWVGRAIGLAIWAPAAALGFGTGTRGSLVLVALPLVGFLFLRYQAQAAAILRRVSLRAYLGLAATLIGLLILVQIQATFRDAGFRKTDWERVEVTRLKGNMMFSESLQGFELIPKHQAPFYDNFPGEAIVRPIPDAIYWFFVSPIPRAIWTDKPIDPVWVWYNRVVAGTGVEGTTISHGAVGYWYFRYGFWGVLQGGLFIGFLMGVTERLLRDYAVYKPILIVVSLALATFLFRAYRGLQWVELHATLVGLAALAVAILVLRPFFNVSPQPLPPPASSAPPAPAAG